MIGFRRYKAKTHEVVIDRLNQLRPSRFRHRVVKFSALQLSESGLQFNHDNSLDDRSIGERFSIPQRRQQEREQEVEDIDNQVIVVQETHQSNVGVVDHSYQRRKDVVEQDQEQVHDHVVGDGQFVQQAELNNANHVDPDISNENQLHMDLDENKNDDNQIGQTDDIKLQQVDEAIVSAPILEDQNQIEKSKLPSMNKIVAEPLEQINTYQNQMSEVLGDRVNIIDDVIGLNNEVDFQPNSKINDENISEKSLDQDQNLTELQQNNEQDLQGFEVVQNQDQQHEVLDPQQDQNPFEQEVNTSIIQDQQYLKENNDDEFSDFD